MKERGQEKRYRVKVMKKISEVKVRKKERKKERQTEGDRVEVRKKKKERK